MSLFNNTLFDENFELVDDTFTISFFLKYRLGKRKPEPINPVPKQSVRSFIQTKKNAKPVIQNGIEYYRKDDLYVAHYPDSKVKHNHDYLKEQVRYKIMQSLEARKYLPFKGRLMVNKLVFIFSPIASLKAAEKKSIEAGNYVYKDTKPDLTDNLPKLVFDALEGEVFENDSRIVRENNIYKVYGKSPGVFIELKGKI